MKTEISGTGLFESWTIVQLFGKLKFFPCWNKSEPTFWTKNFQKYVLWRAPVDLDSYWEQNGNEAFLSYRWGISRSSSGYLIPWWDPKTEDLWCLFCHELEDTYSETLNIDNWKAEYLVSEKKINSINYCDVTCISHKFLTKFDELCSLADDDGVFLTHNFMFCYHYLFRIGITFRKLNIGCSLGPFTSCLLKKSMSLWGT